MSEAGAPKTADETVRTKRPYVTPVLICEDPVLVTEAKLPLVTEFVESGLAS